MKHNDKIKKVLEIAVTVLKLLVALLQLITTILR